MITMATSTNGPQMTWKLLAENVIILFIQKCFVGLVFFCVPSPVRGGAMCFPRLGRTASRRHPAETRGLDHLRHLRLLQTHPGASISFIYSEVISTRVKLHILFGSLTRSQRVCARNCSSREHKNPSDVQNRKLCPSYLSSM